MQGALHTNFAMGPLVPTYATVENSRGPGFIYKPKGRPYLKGFVGSVSPPS
jgi:hypothetical protein